MKVFISPKEWSHSIDRFESNHMVSLQDPDADLNDLRPEWIHKENHLIGLFYDCDIPEHEHAPRAACIREVIDWLKPRCKSDSKNQFVIHCDAGLGRSPAIGYIAWALHYGPGLEERRSGKCRIPVSTLRSYPIPSLSCMRMTTSKETENYPKFSHNGTTE